jgi:hypothetical protein
MRIGFIAFTFFAGFLGGCGPLISPMFFRPSEDEQKQVDSVWTNLMTPPNRADRQTLLDALTYFHLYSYGVDRASFRSEKIAGNLLIVMEVTYDHDRPMRDTFTVTVFDKQGNLVREEHYSREDVEKALGDIDVEGAATTQKAPTPEEIAAAKERERRTQAVMAATQPATQP